jgi:hypothetical protein
MDETPKNSQSRYRRIPHSKSTPSSTRKCFCYYIWCRKGCTGEKRISEDCPVGPLQEVKALESLWSPGGRATLTSAAAQRHRVPRTTVLSPARTASSSLGRLSEGNLPRNTVPPASDGPFLLARGQEGGVERMSGEVS